MDGLGLGRAGPGGDPRLGLGARTGAAPGRWWAGAGRWSLARLWQGYRQELWGETGFHRVWTATAGNWDQMADWLAARTNATLAASST